MAQKMGEKLGQYLVLQSTLQVKQDKRHIMKHIGILFPHQLFEHHTLIQKSDTIYLIEVDLFFKTFNFHKAKLAFHRSSMRAYFDRVSKIYKKTWKYISQEEEASDIRILINNLVQQQEVTLHYIDPTDNWLRQRILKHKTKIKEVIEYENPLFLNTKEELSDFFKPGKKSFFQTTFYKQQRKKWDILIQPNGDPVGDKWTFDTENRKKYPKKSSPPPITLPEPDSYWEEAIAYVEKHFSNNPGQIGTQPLYPYKKDTAKVWFEQFLERRFHLFGDYEDAILQEEWILHHSVLTPMLNTGLLSVDYVVSRSLEYANTNQVPINSLEGFVRQIIGWREFIRGMYQVKGSQSRTTNFWGFTRKIPAAFYDGTTGIKPVDKTIQKVIKTGYCHHIERLMVLGNFMLLCEFDPNEVYRWFMELFIDAYDWVMVPNVYGMSQFADGGLFATKPYISGSNYLIKMSNYPKGDWQKIWDGLFWHFMDKHRIFFLKNPRLGMLVRTFDKMTEDKKVQHQEYALNFFKKIDK
jgi:deoxyribodipyrimidine photolyase-related protein